jgi:hypothetical protein
MSNQDDCPSCGWPLPLHQAVPINAPGVQPHRGAVGMCFRCGSFMVFDGEPLRPRLMTGEEVASLDDETRILLQQVRRKAKQVWSAPPERCPEYDCVECGRHIVQIAGEIPACRTCALCLFLPRWWADPVLRGRLDPDYEPPAGRDTH